MLKNIILWGKSAYKRNAILIIETPKAGYYNLDGNRFWIPRSVSKFTLNDGKVAGNAKEGTILILKWYYEKNIEPFAGELTLSND